MADEDGSILSDLTESIALMNASIEDMMASVKEIEKKTEDLLQRVEELESEPLVGNSLNAICNELDSLAVKLSIPSSRLVILTTQVVVP